MSSAKKRISLRNKHGLPVESIVVNADEKFWIEEK